MRDTFRIGTRGSRLAMAQTHQVCEALEAQWPGERFAIETIRTTGDQNQESSLDTLGVEGVFTKELDTALLDRRVDLAVHSLKDLPTRLTDGIAVAAVPPREDARDVFFGRGGAPLAELSPGARVGTGSLRRRAQLLYRRPDLATAPIRGNVETRLAKLEDGRYDGVLLAAAGLRRLGLPLDNAELLELDAWLPAPGQAAIAVAARADDADAMRVAAALDDAATHVCVDAERTLLAVLEGGCRVPVGAHAQVEKDAFHLRAFVAGEDGTPFLDGAIDGPVAAATVLARKLAEDLLARGGGEILRRIRMR